MPTVTRKIYRTLTRSFGQNHACKTARLPMIVLAALLFVGWAQPGQALQPSLTDTTTTVVPAVTLTEVARVPATTPRPTMPATTITAPEMMRGKLVAPVVTTAPTETLTSTLVAIPPTATPVIPPENWQQMPVIPTLGERAIAIYQKGLALGNDPHVFTKIGDGEISALWFLTNFDLGPQYYDLGPYQELTPVIDYFAGSFGHHSQAARRGFNTTRILDPKQADPSVCNQGETPLECELRLYHPSFALVSMGTNQVWEPVVFETELRVIVETLIERGVVPILSTKADNLEGDYRINGIIASLAYEYDIPLWNFWAAVQPLPDHGLQADFEHLTYAGSDFDDPSAMSQAWPIRNLTALQVLDAIRQLLAS